MVTQPEEAQSISVQPTDGGGPGDGAQRARSVSAGALLSASSTQSAPAPTFIHGRPVSTLPNSTVGPSTIR